MKQTFLRIYARLYSTFSSGILPVARGGTGLSSLGDGIVYASSSPAFSTLSNGSSGDVLTSNGPSVAPSWQPVPGFTGTGTASYIPYFNTASSLGSSPLFVSGGNVGVGTASPSEKLDIGSGNIGFVSGTSRITWNDGGLNRSYIQRTRTDGDYFTIANNNSASGIQLGTQDGTNPFSPKVTMTSAGNVGIGTTAPTAALEVAGVIKITGGSPAAGKVLTSDATGGATWQTPSASLSGSTSSSVTTLGFGTDGISGSNNTAIGSQSSYNLTSGTNNTTVGYNAGYNLYLTGNSGNTLIGSNAGYYVGSNGSNNTYVGMNSGPTISDSGTNSVALGYAATVSGSGGVAIGSGASAPANTVVIGSHNGSTFQERMRIDSTGNMGIGTTTPAGKLHVAGNVRATAFEFNGGGPAISSIVTCTETAATTTGGPSITVNGSGCSSVTASHTCTCQFAASPAPSSTTVIYSTPNPGSVSVGLSGSLTGNTAVIKCICVQ